MERLTETRGDDVLYIGKHARLVEIGENASTMRVAATRDVLQRLAEYEATGLTPEEVAELQGRNNVRLVVPVTAVRISEKDLQRVVHKRRRII
jgi:hypothetical protein